MHLIRTLLPRSGVDASREPLNERAWTSSGPEVESWTASGHATLQTPPSAHAEPILLDSLEAAAPPLTSWLVRRPLSEPHSPGQVFLGGA